jgi:hypothetical protein
MMMGSTCSDTITSTLERKLLISIVSDYRMYRIDASRDNYTGTITIQYVLG